MSYKYTIHTRLLKLNVQDYEIAMQFIPRLCGITSSTFKSWIYMKKDSSNEIPGTALVKMAQFFECPVEEMFDNPLMAEKVREDLISFKMNTYVPSRKFRTV